MMVHGKLERVVSTKLGSTRVQNLKYRCASMMKTLGDVKNAALRPPHLMQGRGYQSRRETERDASARISLDVEAWPAQYWLKDHPALIAMSNTRTKWNELDAIIQELRCSGDVQRHEPQRSMMKFRLQLPCLCSSQFADISAKMWGWSLI